MSDHPNALPVGYRLNEYEIKGVLGSGGFGVTYKAYDHDLDKTVAIKEYLPLDFAARIGRTTVGPKSDASKDDYDWGLARLLDEARTLARFDHPHINKVLRFIKANGTAYLVLEYIDGDMLSDLLRDKGHFSEAGIRRMLDELLDGLDAVHKAGYVHRDIKPANIMFRRNGSAVLLDFGAARQARGQTVTKVFTASYAPVEQHLNNPVGARSDIYSLGICAYRCLIGGDESVLVDAPNRALLIQQGQAEKDMPPAVVVGKGKYNDGLLKAIDWAMQVDEGDRPQSVGELQAALAGEVEVAATSTAVNTVKKAVKKDSVKSVSVKVSAQTKETEVPMGWVYGVIGLAVLVAVGAGVGLPQYAQWQEEKIAEAEWQRAAEERRQRQIAEAARQRAAEAERQRKNAEAAADYNAWRNVDCGNESSVRAYLQKYPDGIYREVANECQRQIAAADRAEAERQRQIDEAERQRAAEEWRQRQIAGALKAEKDAFSRLVGRDADASAWQVDIAGATDLHIAAAQGWAKLAQWLIDNGANVHARIKSDGKEMGTTLKKRLDLGSGWHRQGQYPLHFALTDDNVAAAKVLIENGANVNAADTHGRISLHTAAWNNNNKMARFLLDNGANANAQNQHDGTPLDNAIFNDHDSMQSLLRRHGGRCNATCP